MLTFLPLLTLLQAPSLLGVNAAAIAPLDFPLPSVERVQSESSTLMEAGELGRQVSLLAAGHVVRSQDVRPLPGTLDSIPVFNSNSPEVIQENGIIVSTFSPDGMDDPSAHLDYAFDGRFDIFAHHVARGLDPNDVRTMYNGIILHNPGNSPITINVSQAASYLSQEAPFFDLPSYVANPLGDVFSGPGSRVMGDILRGLTQPHWPTTITIAPQQSHLLVNLPIPLRRLTVPVNGTLPPGQIILPPIPSLDDVDTLVSSKVVASGLTDLDGEKYEGDAPESYGAVAKGNPDDGGEYLAQALPTNGRTTLMRLFSSGPVRVASLAMYAPQTEDNHERVPTLAEWETVLKEEGLSGPRDYPPTPPNAQHFSRFFYGRVAGVAKGSQWLATLTDDRSSSLTIPSPGKHISYALSTLDHNTFGTGQIQSAPMVTRYPDTAYRAHGNYGIHYNLTLPLHNDTDRQQQVAIKFETPIQNEDQDDSLTFLNPPEDRIFFRGTILLRYVDSWNLPQARYFHVVHRRGQEGKALVRLNMRPGDRRLVKVEFLYPPDATPPQVLTVETK